MPDNFYDSFDEATKTKLDLFEKYLGEWFPVFLMNPYKRHIRIIDFFCGKGKDGEGTDGSPLIILKVLQKFFEKYPEKFNGKKIEILFNDSNTEYINKLKENITEIDIDTSIQNCITYHNYEFKECFNHNYLSFHNSANLIFLDQFGIKEVTKDIFQKLFQIPSTDFLFFSASSFIKRFIDRNEFQNVWWMEKGPIKISNPKEVHRKVVEEYKKLAPSESYVIPFTLKKGNNVYGLVFCSKHILAADKFLKVAWKKDSISGEANFDINDDEFTQLQLFGTTQTKIAAFEEALKKEILSGKIKNNIETYKIAISNGFTANHAKVVVKNLEENKKIILDKPLSLSYDYCIKKNKLVSFTIQ